MNYFIFKTLSFTIFLLINLFLAIKVSYFFIDDVENHTFFKYLWQIPIYLFFYFYYKLLHKRMVTSSEIISIIKANTFAMVLILFFLFISKSSYEYSRTIMIIYFSFNMLIVIYTYFVKDYFLKYDFLREKVFALCDREGEKSVKRWFNKNNTFGFDVKKIIIIEGLSEEEIKERIDKTIKSENFYACIISLNNFGHNQLFYYIDHIQHDISRIIVLPNVTKIPLFNMEIQNSINHKDLLLFVKNNLLNPVDSFIKNLFDKIVATILIILFFPFLIILYIAVFISTNGHPLFKHRRIGQNGVSFNIYKFRSMKLNSDEILKELLENDEKAKEEWERDFKLKNDPRVTKIGKFLRKTSLDELPQIINVLQGKMSLVGPRPIVKEEIEKYGEYFQYFKAVKPGITGLWQVSGRNDIDYEERVQLDVWYARNWSIELDITILIKTIAVVLSRRGSY